MATYTAGTAVGGLFSGWVAERFGRKRTIIVAAAFGMLSCHVLWPS